MSNNNNSTIYKDLSQQHPSSPTKTQSKLSSQQYTHLTVKQIKQAVSQFDIDYYTSIQTYMKPLNKTANKIQQLMHTHLSKQQMIYSLVKQIKKSQQQQYTRLKQMIKSQLQQKAHNLSQMQSRQKTFAIDCFRQVISYPFKQSHIVLSTTKQQKYNQQQQQIMGYNFIAFWRLCLQRQLRRVLWQKSLINQETKQYFFTYDHQLTPYNIQMQFRLTIQRIAQKQGIRLKQLQKDMAIKLLQYTVKRTNTLPNRSQVYLSLTVVQLFSYYNMSRVNEIGAVYCGLQSLGEYYYQQSVNVRLQRLMKVIEYVDVVTYSMLNEYFFKDVKRVQKARIQLNEIYEHFRLSLTSRYLPLNSSQYMIDQLLIKKRTKIDMYVMFAIVILVLGDHIEKLLQLDGSGDDNKVDVNNRNNGGRKNVNNSSVNKLNDMANNINNGNKSQVNPNNNNSNIPNNNNPVNNNKPITIQKSPLVQKLQSSSPHKITNNQSSLLSTTKDITIKQIFQQSKQIIKLQQVVQAFNVVFQKIPATFSSEHKLKQTNRLFSYMLEIEKIQKQNKLKTNKNGVKQQSSKNINSNNKNNNNSVLIKQQLIMDEQDQLIKQLQQLQQQQQQPMSNINNKNNFVIIKNNKANFQRLGRRI